MAAIYISFVLVNEVHLYISMRREMDLFIEVKLMKRQQNNLTNLLDALPDSVLVCTKSTEETRAKPVFSNVKLNEFFGCDVLNSHS